MTWDDNWVRALVTIAAATVGAIFASMASAYSARQKIREVELAYLYKLRDGYLDNARKVTGEVYIPVNVAITNLFKGYEKFVASAPSGGSGKGSEAEKDFVECCNDFLEELDGLFARGADAYLTTTLDSDLNDFMNFVRNSITQTEVKRR